MTDDPNHSDDQAPQPEPRPLDENGQFSQRIAHQQVSARVPESVARGVYASGSLVINGQHEFIIDFLQSVTRPQQVVVRIVLPPTIVPGLLRAMHQNIKLHNERFGEIPPLPKPPAGTLAPSVEEIYQQLKLPDEISSGTYANTVMITHNPSDFCFDFITGFYPRSTVAARVYMSGPQVPRLLETLSRSYDQYQQKLAAARRKQAEQPPDEDPPRTDRPS